MAKKKKTKKPYQSKAKRKKKTLKLTKRARKLKTKKKIEKTVKKIIKPKITRPTMDDSTIHKTKTRVIGIGGGGGTVVSEIISRIKKADFYVANTDAQALGRVARQAKKFQFGQSLTQGLGTGMNMELGERVALEEKEKIKKLFEGQDLCIVVACLGGGTSSGATPVFAKIAKSLGVIAYGIFTLPFEFEGDKKMEMAKTSLEMIKPHLNAYTVIPNERIFQIIDKNTPLKEALSAINKRLAENLGGLIEMIYLPSLINIDFADLRTILAGRGRLAYLNTVEIEEPNKEEITKKLISSPLYPYTIRGARGVLYNITSSRDVQLSEVSRISRIISEAVNRQAKIIFGINQNQKYQDRVKITLLATGCSGAKGFLTKPAQAVKTPAPVSKKPPTKKSSNKKQVSKKPSSKKQVSKKLKKKPKKKIKPRKTGKSKQRAKQLRLLKKTKKQKIQKKEETKKPKTTIKPKIKVEKKEARPPQRAKPQREQEPGEGKVRKDGLQLRKEAEAEERELLEREKIWETPAILRRKGSNNQ